MKYAPQVGDKHGRLTVTGALVKDRHYRLVPVRCECVTEKTIRADHLGSGRSKSCGCLSIETSRERQIHGETTQNGKTPEWLAWHGMKQRCYNPRATAYDRYGGRGISVCARWLDSFPAFLSDMGRRPTPSHTLERKDNSAGYTPGNCRWATPTEQANNRRSNRMVTFQGRTQSLAEWARELRLNYGNAIARLNRGWTPEKAFAYSLV